jgi:hypothetical protein
MELHRFAIRQALGALEVTRRRQHGANESFDIGHQRMMVDAHAIPLDQRELRVVPAAAFAVAVDLADLPDVAASGREQALHRVLGRGLQKTAAAIHSRLDTRQMHVRYGSGSEIRRFDLERARCREVLAR